jgi:hypothetical protein
MALNPPPGPVSSAGTATRRGKEIGGMAGALDLLSQVCKSSIRENATLDQRLKISQAHTIQHMFT